MNKVLLPLGLVAAVLVIGPSTASANLVLDMPPILAKGTPPPSACTSNATCAANTPSTPYCCGGVCQATVCPSACTSNATCAANTPSTPYCCGGTCQAIECSGALNDTGITAKVGAGLQDADFGRDKTNNVDTDGHAGFWFEKIISGGKTCVKDNVTGLTWSPDMGAHTSSGITNLINANSNLCGKTGWRLPTLDELLSIVSYHKINPAIDNDAARGLFADTQSVVYWSSTQSAATAGKRWGVNFAFGTPAEIDEGLDNKPVRLVQK